jgi:hypothetical protein
MKASLPVAVAVALAAASGASAAVTGTPMVIWGKPGGPDATQRPPIAWGPTGHQLAVALADGSGAPPARLRLLACSRAGDGASQFICAYEQRDPSGAWAKWSAQLAADGRGWRLVGGPTATP